MITRVRWLKSNTLFASAIAFASLVATPGCAEFAEWISFDSATDKADARAKADAASLWEMTLMAGRYGVMLDQAREILKLPEPGSAGPMFPSGAEDDAGQRKALAAYQVNVAGEFFADAARACKRRRVPAGIRAMACAHRAGAPEELRKPAPLDVAALSARNDALDKVVMPWWDAVCATAPKPKDGDMPACAME